MGLQFQLLYTEFDSKTESMRQNIASAICIDMLPFNVYIYMYISD